MEISQESQEEVDELAFFPCCSKIICSHVAFSIGFEERDDKLIGLCKEFISYGVFPLSWNLFEETGDTQEEFVTVFVYREIGIEHDNEKDIKFIPTCSRIGSFHHFASLGARQVLQLPYSNKGGIFVGVKVLY